MAERRIAKGAVCLLTALAMVLIGAGTAIADVNIHKFEAFPSETQAGGHPDLTLALKVDYYNSPQEHTNCQCNDAKNVHIELPAGFIGNPHATPRCSSADFARDACPTDSQIGLAEATVEFGDETIVGPLIVPLYNVMPKPTQAGLYGWKVPLLDSPIYTVLAARTDSDYGLNAFADGIIQYLALVEYTTHLWGVPADSSHDAARVPSGPSNSPRTPFLQNPERCDVDLSSHLSVDGYDGTTTHADADWPDMTGCDSLAFNPSLSAQPTTTETDAPSGLEVDLKVPQNVSPDVPSPSEIRGATVSLAEGFSLNPNAADGKLSCTDAEARFGTQEEARCPEYSKIGSVEVDSSALPTAIPGAVYLGEPLPGERYRVFLAANGFATHIKISGVATLDPHTGAVTISFDELPESPLTEFNLHIFGSERGIFATPTHCGTYAVNSTFVPWDEALSNQSATQFFTLDSGPGGSPCPPDQRPFSPTFEASSESNTGGAYTPFSVSIDRRDGDQTISDIAATPPPGLLASLRSIPYCPESALTTAAGQGYSGLLEMIQPVCPAASQVGVSDSGAGAGSHPVHLPGKVYLAGPYKGAPVSLAVVTPAVSGPYDLGNVVVRIALHVDPLTAQVRAVTDPIPQIFESIPLRLRSLLVSLDRPGFALNPTNCEAQSVGADISGDQGAHASLSSYYQVANCSILPYKPNLTLALSGGVNRRGHPAIRAVLTAGPGEANSRSISVALPKGEQLDNSHLGTVCTRVDFASDSCPAGSQLGNVEVVTPLLEKPLTGIAYLRSSQQGLPDLALKLKGQVDFEAVAKIDSVHEGLRATFKSIPDVPFSRITLNLAGGKKGLLQNTENLCGAGKKAKVSMTGQNGATLRRAVPLKLSCGKARHKRHKRRHDGGGHDQGGPSR